MCTRRVIWLWLCGFVVDADPKKFLFNFQHHWALGVTNSYHSKEIIQANLLILDEKYTRCHDGNEYKLQNQSSDISSRNDEYIYSYTPPHMF